jgi:hypothetical protein
LAEEEEVGLKDMVMETAPEAKGGRKNEHMINQNLCIKCGKQRIIVSTHKEIINNSVVTTKKMVCPDPECQRKVDEMLNAEEQKRHRAILSKQQFVKRPSDISLNSQKAQS